MNFELTPLLMTLVFIVGYIFITVEHQTKVNKTTVALLMAIVCWVILFLSHTLTHKEGLHFLGEHLSDVSQIVFFLIGALTIVETINVHKGFKVISDSIQFTSKRKLLWVTGVISFFLSAVLDNLTTTVVMVSLLQKIVDDREDRLLLGGAVVIAANAGGVWTPIGDVTTTMLWIGGQLSTLNMIKDLFLPSVACAVAAFILIHGKLLGHLPNKEMQPEENQVEPMGKLIFYLGIACLISVPVFKIVTGLPPFMGILLGMSIMWLVTDLIHRHYEDRYHLRMPNVLSRIDLSGPLFFLGILLCINALETVGLLHQLAAWFTAKLGNMDLIAIVIGLASAVVDNVPLVAASMAMFDLSTFPQDDDFWKLIAYCAGTGGSILIIGSAAGVVFMGLEKVDFFWYLRRIALPAMVGYFAGLAVYFLLNAI